MRLVGLAVVEHALVLKCVEVGELGKSLCKKRMPIELTSQLGAGQ